MGVMRMKCAWQAFINLLPPWMRPEVDRLGKDTLQELRLRLALKPELIRSNGPAVLDRAVSNEDLCFVINAGSQYSPWAAVTSAKGYITAPGGHRIGLCGQAVMSGGVMTGVREPSSLCLRVARDFIGIGNGADTDGSLLIIGRPGSGKTTLLRDLIRIRSDTGTGSVAVVDEREEIFPHWQNVSCFPAGKRTDILRGCGKAQGIEAVLRSMGPGTIAVDEITAAEDCEALLNAGWCGVKLLATAHAGSVRDLMRRPVYAPVVSGKLFDKVIVLRHDKSWTLERMGI